MNYKKMLLKENPKAFQYLHHAHGFNFEKPFFLGSFPGRFTYKMVNDMINANIGDNFTAALLVKPDKKGYSFTRLHHVTMQHGKFNIESRRDLYPWSADIDHFFSVGDFERTRKTATERVYIIAQNPDFLVTPKNNIQLESNTRYRIAVNDWRNGVTKASDGRGGTFISEIVLQPTDGKRGKATFKPWNSFYPSEKKSNDINDYIDKSGYILRFRRMDLKGRAIALKAQHDAERLEKTDFSERENKARADIAAVKRYLIDLIENAETYENGRHVSSAATQFGYLLHDFENLQNWTFRNVESKNNHFNKMENRVNEILNGGKN